MSADLNYVWPENLNEAQEFLWNHGKETAVIAGGTDILVNLRSSREWPNYLLDVSRLSELKGITINDAEVMIGAGVTLSEIYASRILTRFAPALQKAAFVFASKQIRNVATIGGNVAHCSPCADTIPPLIIHEAKVVLTSLEGERTVPIQTLPMEPYKSSIRPEEIITRFILKPAEGIFSDFQKVGRRKELATARLSVAVMAEKDSGGRITFMRFALGSCTPTPRRMVEVENFLIGRVPDKALIWEAGQMLATEMVEISGRRPSTIYKQKAVQGLFMRTLYPIV